MTKQQSKNRKINGGWLFLGSIVLFYGVTMLVNFSLAKESLQFFSHLFMQIIPILAIVYILMVLINFFLTPDHVKNYTGKSSGLKGWLLAVIGGILSTGPIYTWYILLGELKQQGMKTSLIAVFLYSRAIKLPLLPLLVHYFGITYTLILSFYLIVFSLISGVITGALVESKNITN